MSKKFETSPKIEISHLSVEMINIIIWVPLSMSHNFIHRSQMVY